MKKKTSTKHITPPAAKPLLPAVFLIGVVGMDLFPQRMHLEKEIGEVLYKQLISVLELIGREVTCNNEMTHYRFGVYLDTHNPGTRVFELEEKAFDAICENFDIHFTNICPLTLKESS